MAVVTTKSPSITNLDATPIIASPTGEANQGMLRINSDSVPAANGDSIASIYRLVRIPTNAKVKSLFVTTTAITVGAADIDIAFSDSLRDGSASYQQFAGGIVQITGPVDNKLFGAAQTLVATSPVARKDVTFAGTFTFANENQPLWLVLVALGATQFSSDPGGNFDIVLKLTSAVTTTGTVDAEFQYVM
jgi:hypothetical protein